MKSKLTNRLLMTMVVAVMLSVVFAVSSLAITGGFDVIEGLEDGKNYEAASVTINAEGTGKAIDEANIFDLDANNEPLAGLYVVREEGETEWSDIVYVYGSISKRKALGERIPEGETKAGYYYVKSSAEFAVGYFTSTTTNYTNSAFGTDGISTNGSHLSNTVLRQFSDATDENAKSKAFESIQTTLKQKNIKYALTNEEITPISEVSDYTFKLQEQRGGLKYTGLVMKFVAHIMDKNGDVYNYSYNIAPFDYAYKALSAHNSHTVDFTAASWYAEGSEEAGELPEEGYFVGFTLYPFEGVNDSTKLSASTRTGNNRFVFQNVKYNVIGEVAPKPEIKAFPVIAGGYGEISGLNPDYLYEYQYSEDEGATWTDWEDGQVPAGATAFKVEKAGLYGVRAKETSKYGASDIATIVVDTYTDAFESFDSEVAKIHLPNDFVELSAEYEMDLTVKNWVSSLAFENIKAVSPDSVITLTGDGYKFVVKASNIAIDSKVHYYNMAVSLDGESRYNTLHDLLVDKAGEGYVTDVYFESSHALPFVEAQVMIEVGSALEGSDIRVNFYNEETEGLRKVEDTIVYEGWVTFNSFSDTYVLTTK